MLYAFGWFAALVVYNVISVQDLRLIRVKRLLEQDRFVHGAQWVIASMANRYCFLQLIRGMEHVHVLMEVVELILIEDFIEVIHSGVWTRFIFCLLIYVWITDVITRRFHTANPARYV